MAISPIKKISLVGLRSDRQIVMDLLQDCGVAEIIESDAKVSFGTDDVSAAYFYAQVNFAISFLTKYNKKKTSLKDMLSGGKIELTKNKLTSILSSFDFKEVVKKCEEYDTKINQFLNIIEKNKSSISSLKVWKKLSFVPKEEIETEKTKTLLGSVVFNKYEELVTELEKNKFVVLNKVHADEKDVYFTVTFVKNLESELRPVLSHFEFKPAQLPKMEKELIFVKDEIKFLQDEIENFQKEIETIEKDVKILVGNLENLQVVSDNLSWQKEQEQALENSHLTEKTFSIICWIEEKNLGVLKGGLDKTTSNYEIEEIEIEKNEAVPVNLNNNALIEPFESVTGVYGMPLTKEVDPTPFLAPFFFVFFGFCVSDAGYGLIITLTMLAMLKFLKIPKDSQKLIKLLVLGGISTLIAGALFGSWFGIDVTLLAETSIIKKFVMTFKVIDPVKDPITVMIIAFIMGIIQIMVGLIINTFWKIKNGDIKEALLGSGLWFVTILMIVFWVMTKVGVLPASLGDIMTYVVIGCAVALVLAGGRNTDNIFLKLPIGLYGLYDVVGYLSDVLSYSRLLALGLATGIIAMVINLIARLAIDMVPYVGYVIALFILIGGHVFNIGINALGAFIHAGRLQFVEFFPKFMEGGGSRFKPFQKQAKYVRIIK